MYKLYLSYFVMGLFLFFIMLFFLGFSNGFVGFWKYESMIASVMLFSTVSVISLFKPKIAAALGVVGLCLMFPFVWIIAGEVIRGSANFFTITITFILFWYLISLIMSIGVILDKSPSFTKPMNKPLRKVLVLTPPATFFMLMGCAILIYLKN